MDASCGAKTSAARLAAASLPIRSMGHKRSRSQKVSQKFCGQPKSKPPRYSYLGCNKPPPTASLAATHAHADSKGASLHLGRWRPNVVASVCRLLGGLCCKTPFDANREP